MHELGNDQREACIQRAIDWTEAGRLSPLAMQMREESLELHAEEREEANRRRSARRAKTKVRRLCKALGVDCLLTLTYRANQTDLAVMKKDFKEFVRRLRRLIPGFAYVAAFEQQKRGAWHCHMAMHRLPKTLPARNGVKVKSFNIVRAVWRSVSKENEGNIDSQNAKPWHSPGRLAAYLSKYMLKAFDEGDDWSNRYSGSSATCIPKPVRQQFEKASLNDLIAGVYAQVAVGGSDVFTWLSRFGDTFYVSSEPDLGGRALRPWEV